MFNSVVIKEVAITFTSTLAAAGVIWLVKGFFKQSLTRKEVSLVINLIIALTLSTFFKSYHLLDSFSWIASLIITAGLLGGVNTLLPLLLNRLSLKQTSR